MEFAMGLFALAYSGLVLFVLAGSLRKMFPPMRAAMTAFVISSVVHGATTLLMGEHAAWAFAFWGIPHLLILPALLWTARRQNSTGA
ncbi:hypothetical protein [Falsiroseomonas oryziterrae]|uniref:hypothetical protein n=1 Tax=Falsiroseomonas oryziterrae TaxID=2911368 RepID=UPI001F37BDA5|nr:hypothetical protein [Roseomonas sp. NPKOSM-4]